MQNQVTLKIDGKDISLNPFVNDIFANIVRAMVNSLDRIPQERETIEIKLEKEKI